MKGLALLIHEPVSAATFATTGFWRLGCLCLRAHSTCCPNEGGADLILPPYSGLVFRAVYGLVGYPRRGVAQRSEALCAEFCGGR
jgi:hypothetical protein